MSLQVFNHPPVATPAVPLHAMRSEDFVARAIAILVNPAMVGGAKRLCAVDDSQDAVDRLAEEFMAYAPKGANLDWARGRVEDLFASPFSDDVWHSRLPHGTPVVLIKYAAIDGRMDVREALRRLHVKEISRALSEGLAVPQSVLDDYRSIVESMTATREVH